MDNIKEAHVKKRISKIQKNRMSFKKQEKREEFQRGLFAAKEYFEVNDRRDNSLCILKEKYNEWYQKYDKTIFGATRKDTESFNRFRKAPTDQVSVVVKNFIDKVLSNMLDRKTQEQYFQLYLWYSIVMQHTDTPNREDAVRKAKEIWLGNLDGELGEYEKNNLQVYGVEKESYFSNFGTEECELTSFILKNWKKFQYLNRLWG